MKSLLALFRRIRGAVTGLNAIQHRFDGLQTSIDQLAMSIMAVTSSRENFGRNGDSKISTERFRDSNELGGLSNILFESGRSDSNKTYESKETAVTSSLLRLRCELNSHNKIAFLIHHPMMLVHYADVWRELGASNFVIILADNFSSDISDVGKLSLKDFIEITLSEGYEIRNVTEVVSCGMYYEYVVTNHPISGSRREIKCPSLEDSLKKIINYGLFLEKSKVLYKYEVDSEVYLPLQVGKKQVRFMYGADISEGWSLSEWNSIYDIFLCHGVNDEREIRKRFHGKTYVMGYPRYDRFFSGNCNLTKIKNEFGIDESKRTILWMPTLGGDYSSIPLFAESISLICHKYNIIVRPHPLSFVQEVDFITLLEKYNFSIDRTALRDMNELYSIADVVLADNGGTPFSAIFVGKNVVFLDVPDDLGIESAASHYISKSSVLELKKYLPVIRKVDFSQLECLLDSAGFYKENGLIVNMLFERYFASPRGDGAKRVAKILLDL